jgi:hypothetical protein
MNPFVQWIYPSGGIYLYSQLWDRGRDGRIVFWDQPGQKLARTYLKKQASHSGVLEWWKHNFLYGPPNYLTIQIGNIGDHMTYTAKEAEKGTRLQRSTTESSV